MIYFERIISSALVDGTFYETNPKLIEDIKISPSKYTFLFNNTANLKILNYLAECNRMDSVPYKTDFFLVKKLDGDCIDSTGYFLNDEQYKQIVCELSKRSKNATKTKIKRLCMNVLSVYTKSGLYVLAYRELNLDIKNRCLRPGKETVICRDFSVNGQVQSVRKFLDAEDYYLLDNFEENLEDIKNCITLYGYAVDDMPYIMELNNDIILDLMPDYNAILDMYDSGTVTVPIKAFFGDLISPSRRRKDYPITLINNKVNLDQLLAIHNAIKYPIVYVQGPPGTGKTNTIINTLVTAFFNEKTVLFSSYNNHPIDGVFAQLSNLKYKNNTIPFPILRLGNNEKTLQAIDYIGKLFRMVENISIYENALSKKKHNKTEQTAKLTELLKKHEEIVELNERREAITELINSNENMRFKMNLTEFQLAKIDNRLSEIGNITDEEALALLTNDNEEFAQYLYYMSAKYIRHLREPKYETLMNIVKMTDESEKIRRFNQYIKDNDNLKKLLKVFPIIATTCISAQKLGEPVQSFDMTVMDEASQCNTAVSLVPIVRGTNLLLVGDPQQLNPVVVLDPAINNALRKKYSVADEYDYIKNSIYKTCLACDAVSNEILLSYHYRCNRAIIDFSNKKYYNNKLKIKTVSQSEKPLMFINIENDTATYKNTAPAEVDKIIQYAQHNPDKSIGVITPFTNQRNLIKQELAREGLNNITCGTVHAFQGDEKDIILFSLALTDKTHPRTYEWLKNNKELVNVAVSRAKEKFVVISSQKELDRLHTPNSSDDIYELVNYVKTKGTSEVTQKNSSSRALGIKPYSTETEEAFLTSLNHALDNIIYTNTICSVEKEVAISQVFRDNITNSDLFYTGRFDFVIYKRSGNQKIPVLAIELDGKEHIEDEIVKARDEEKNNICLSHGFKLIRVENSYARRYNYIKEILLTYFGNKRNQI
ncbi:MAG: AAA domain-containing protein [Ruminococcus sp.]